MKEESSSFNVLSIFYILFLLFMIHRCFFSSSLIAEKTISYIVYPFLRLQGVIVYPVKKLEASLKSFQSLHEKIDSLQIERNDLYARVVELEAIHEFIKETKEVVSFSDRYKKDNYKLSQVLLRIQSEQQDVIYIDVGMHGGAEKDTIVLYKNNLVGRVIEVFGAYSVVALITDQRCKIAGHCLKTESLGISVGKNNGNLQFSFVPHYQKVEIGDIVLSSGEGLLYPKGFSLGRILSVNSDNVEHQIELKPVIDIDQLNYVYLMLKR